jgi:diguanylate cyclase (GGDEF)-like protein
MSVLGRMRHFFCLGILVFWLGAAFATAPGTGSGDAAQRLDQADGIKTLDHARFTGLLQRLDKDSKTLPAEQLWKLHYLQAWESGYQGDYDTSLAQLDDVARESADPTLRFRAAATAINVLANVSRYQEAFERLTRLLQQLPTIRDRDARVQGLTTAAFLYVEAGQYDLASSYADRALTEGRTIREYTCKGWYMKLAALYRSGNLSKFHEQLPDGIKICNEVGDVLFTNLMRFYAANLHIQQGHPREAIQLLRAHYQEVQRGKYPWLMSQFDASLAQAYWDTGAIEPASQFALSAVGSGVKSSHIESLASAYRLLYLIEQRKGNLGLALSYHEKYMVADKGYLDDVSAKALAYQMVNQQMLAKKFEIEALSRQNQILQLRQTLDSKADETKRLYIILLLMVLAFIVLWTVRIKRSQLRFMKLARRDGLTGIFNRQHFLSEADRVLKYCAKSSRAVCLVLIDLDHFKVVNDTYGHATGDKVLKRVVAVCLAQLNSTEAFGRLGGEEFAILLPECTLEQAMLRADRIRSEIACSAGSDDTPDIEVSASFGVAAATHSGYVLRVLLIDADDALYRSKRAGRNQVTASAVADAARDAVSSTSGPL